MSKEMTDEQRIWVLRIKSGPMKGTAVSHDGPPSNAYRAYVPESELSALREQVKVAREAMELAQQFNDGIRARVALKEPHYTASSILKDMLAKALAVGGAV